MKRNVKKSIDDQPSEIARAQRINVIRINEGWDIITVVPSGEKHFSLVVYEDGSGVCLVRKKRTTAVVKGYPIIKNLIGALK